MRGPSTTNLLLGLIALLLTALLFQPLWKLPAVSADSVQEYPLSFEPGVYMLRAPDGSRQVFGRVAIDRRTGTVWGFPTTTQDPYPVIRSRRSHRPHDHSFWVDLRLRIQGSRWPAQTLPMTCCPKRSISSRCGLDCSRTSSTPTAANSSMRSCTCSGVPTKPLLRPRFETE